MGTALPALLVAVVSGDRHAFGSAHRSVEVRSSGHTSCSKHDVPLGSAVGPDGFVVVGGAGSHHRPARESR